MLFGAYIFIRVLSHCEFTHKHSKLPFFVFFNAFCSVYNLLNIVIFALFGLIFVQCALPTLSFRTS